MSSGKSTYMYKMIQSRSPSTVIQNCLYFMLLLSIFYLTFCICPLLELFEALVPQITDGFNGLISPWKLVLYTPTRQHRPVLLHVRQGKI